LFLEKVGFFLQCRPVSNHSDLFTARQRWWQLQSEVWNMYDSFAICFQLWSDH